MKTTFICQLPQTIQEEIKNEIISFLVKEEYNKEEIKEILSNAMNSRLIDIEEIINIAKYI